MALFGAPVVLEDDPERAVRVAQAVRDRVREEEQVPVRGWPVNTGRRRSGWARLGQSEG
jgi:hypothetical protein